ncbi:DUF4345 domain-containing protein [Yinghuangia seranimata]|uniref:DUF4345 domain-containing protein n=1 Tax=Yinghuangia seranimata TaxID=408067 RepID=UPI00248B76EE|nr:DUF4345 domain-containing protein [Yinghuangia seranimata]MDI2131330.1 DUF4345 domain-containing protein [Yinghuangia seranimata]
MARLLKWLSWTMGIACVAIGATHMATGMDSVPGASSAGPTVDSLVRFFSATFLGYGLAWIWVARQSPIPSKAVRWLAGVFFLGGVSRLLSWGVQGRPQWFQLVLLAIELVLPAIYFWLSTADERHHATSPRATDKPIPVSPPTR